MELRFPSTLHHSDTPLLQSRLLFLVPLHYDATHYSAVPSVILNEVKDLSSENRGKLDVASFVRSLAFDRDDRDYFFSFHFSTTPCGR